jgi:hypothetical protein
MSLLEICERIQETPLSRLIGESTWGYPIVGALHVLAMALFGGWVLIASRRGDPPRFAVEARRWKAAGLFLVLLTGGLLFVSQPVRYYESAAFRVKLALLALILLNAFVRRSAPRKWLTLTLWAAAILAARGIAFF